MTAPFDDLLLTPRRVEVSPELWAAAAFIAGLRTASNEEGRRQFQDRGALVNAVVDLQGVVAELLLVEVLTAALPDEWEVSHSLLLWEGGGGEAASAGVDIALRCPATAVAVRRLDGSDSGTVDRPPLELRLEAKSHLDLPDDLVSAALRRKRDFAVNYEAVRDSYANGAVGLVPVAFAPGRGNALVGRMIPIAQVLTWECIDYGYGHPALRRPLAELSPLAWGGDWTALQSTLQSASSVITMDLLVVLHQLGFKSFAALAEDPTFELADLSGADAIALAASRAREVWTAAGRPRRIEE